MAIQLAYNATSYQPFIASGLDLACIANLTSTLAKTGLEVSHMVTIGGWDQTHPNALVSGSAWWAVWKAWNQQLMAAGWAGFDGIDWDIEGVDKISSADNTFSLALLHLIGDMSTAAKADGFSVSLTPCESYFDVYNPYFDYSLTHAYAEYPKFPYHGANTYAYLYAKYPDAFDIVSVQLYESWSHANYQTSVVQVPPAAFLEGWSRQLMHGWWIQFGLVPGIDIPSQWLALPANKLVIGLANAWTGSLTNKTGVKAMFIDPTEVQQAFLRLNATNATATPRGVMFWNIASEGMAIQGSQTPVWFAKQINQVLHVRDID